MLHKEFFTAAGQPISSNVNDKELTDWIKKEKKDKNYQREPLNTIK